MKRNRTILQAGFLLLTVIAVFVVKGNAERWCPLGGVEGIYNYVKEGNMPCSLGVSNFYILAALLLLTLLLRRVFCGYMCPIGTISEWLHAGAKRVKIKQWRITASPDAVLSLLKYGVLAAILWFTYRSGELMFRGFDPCYALLSRHGEDITFWAYVVVAGIVLGSLVISVPFCRWLCPLAAVFNPFSRFGLARVKRNESSCIKCGQCAHACPMAIPVDKVVAVTHARCTACQECVAACHGAKQSAMTWGPPQWLGSSWNPGIILVAILVAMAACAIADLAFPLPAFVKSNGIKPAKVATVEVQVANLTCRGRSNLLWYYLIREDEFELKGYLKLEAWPGPGSAHAVVSYDATLNNEDSIRQAITEAYFDSVANVWRLSPFNIKDYNPLGLDSK